MPLWNGPESTQGRLHCPSKYAHSETKTANSDERATVAQDPAMKLHHHIVVTGMLSLGFAAHVQSTAQTKLESEVRTNQAASTISGVPDFDFYFGRWQLHHRRLQERSVWWLEFAAVAGKKINDD